MGFDLSVRSSKAHRSVFARQARLKNAGFTSQQALILLLICFPLGAMAIGLVVLFIQRQSANSTTPVQPPALGRPTQDRSSTSITPLPSDPIPSQSEDSTLSEMQARAIVEEWLSVKQRIFAPPFDSALADQVVAEGPLWTDLTKADGSIAWLKNNNSYYSYSSITVNRVVRYLPSPSMPSIVVSVTESSTLHSPRGTQPSSSTRDWIYTLKEEGGRWKIWDYRKQ